MRKKVIDYTNLKVAIMKKFGTIEQLCKTTKCFNNTYLSRKLNNFVEFKQSDILDLCEVLNIPNKEIGNYFFKEKL